MNQLPLIERAIAHGRRIAVTGPTGQSTYQELVERSERMATCLLDGVDDLKEARVAYLVRPGSDYITTQWGIWRAGGIAVPLSLSATQQELGDTLIDSQVSAMVAASDLASAVAELCRRQNIRLLQTDPPAPPALRALPEVTTNRRAMILYTSGTTSKPKGVVTTHACLQAQIECLIEAWHWRPDDRIPLFLPLHHVHGIVNVMSCAVWSGAEVEAFSKFDLQAILRRVADHAYTVFMAVPTIYVNLIEALESLSPSDCRPIVEGFADMRLMISGSAALPASVHQRWTEMTGQRLLERYGMTEIGMALSNPYDGERRAGAVGQALPGVEVRLRSEGNETITEDGQPGEIQVRGPNVFQEYWNRPEATRESFVDGWFRSGDIAVVEEGYYRIMGRSSVDIIKSGGYKLSALEIEASLLDHPAIVQCAVVGLPDHRWGEIVAAAVVLADNHSLELDALRQWAEDRLSHYKVPRRLLQVQALPRNAMGKVTKPSVSRLFD
jgi:malonyl-CoA/methylmalonyl-CoA synthetase